MYKKIKKFLEALPLVFEYAKKVWDIIDEIINYNEQLEKETLGK